MHGEIHASMEHRFQTIHSEVAERVDERGCCGRYVLDVGRGEMGIEMMKGGYGRRAREGIDTLGDWPSGLTASGVMAMMG